MNARAERKLDVAFAVVPFANLPFPVIGVGLLKAELERAGYASTVRYFNLDFAERIGARAYMSIADSFGSAALLGEWVFSGMLADNKQDEQWHAMEFLAEFPDRRALLEQARGRAGWRSRKSRGGRTSCCGCRRGLSAFRARFSRTARALRLRNSSSSRPTRRW
jgi:hypothetical protein